jgi:hypothetical protein
VKGPSYRVSAINFPRKCTAQLHSFPRISATPHTVIPADKAVARYQLHRASLTQPIASTMTTRALMHPSWIWTSAHWKTGYFKSLKKSLQDCSWRKISLTIPKVETNNESSKKPKIKSLKLCNMATLHLGTLLFSPYFVSTMQKLIFLCEIGRGLR